jgi:hypothetical protein
MCQLNLLKKNKVIGKKQVIGRAIGCISAINVAQYALLRLICGIMRETYPRVGATLWFLVKNTGLKTVSIGL